MGLLHVEEVGLLPPRVVVAVVMVVVVAVAAAAAVVVVVSVPPPPHHLRRFDFQNFVIALGTLGMDLDIVVEVDGEVVYNRYMDNMVVDYSEHMEILGRTGFRFDGNLEVCKKWMVPGLGCTRCFRNSEIVINRANFEGIEIDSREARELVVDLRGVVCLKNLLVRNFDEKNLLDEIRTFFSN